MDLSLVGGKGLSLMKLRNLGYNVPEFFIVTSDMFRDFITYNNLEDKVKSLLTKNEFPQIQELIQNGNFSNQQEEWIFSNYANLKCNLVSVRSSCSKEDGEEKSYAGQFYTGLNIDKECLLNEIKKCFSSLYSKHLQGYAENIYDNFEMAVIVQKMIKSEYAGVAFSKDYGGQSDSILIIEACKGVGDKLVSGITTPTKYFIRKKLNYIEDIEGEELPINAAIENLSKK